ncbi:hypothetical protein CEUSTIGMA_g3341.t1 [Chlamydomonas eustigma]|uniref:EF-hand domain-containing protein n=1 Tax=Chlamydomonas eustigma TaxID=1157962 RepID=A0A250WYH1_9CHLO|nr:hypothetical protein CEUSTIGMA_g3341.t1 [Chlamydomonas eustigma]|eukprot:GAX75898.1 hypothetical protein CEUSTIGMA_g3341.t1 [Chlamydomonas eustigma]
MSEDNPRTSRPSATGSDSYRLPRTSSTGRNRTEGSFARTSSRRNSLSIERSSGDASERPMRRRLMNAEALFSEKEANSDTANVHTAMIASMIGMFSKNGEETLTRLELAEIIKSISNGVPPRESDLDIVLHECDVELDTAITAQELSRVINLWVIRGGEMRLPQPHVQGSATSAWSRCSIS